MRKVKTSCPWCQSKVAPIPTDLTMANFMYRDSRDPNALRDNPIMCPDCYGVGGYVDWEI